MNNQYGLSLVEIMLSLSLGLLLLTLLTEHYLSVKRQYLNTHLLLDEALDVQWIEDLIRDSTRRAGFTPCLNLNRLNDGNPSLKAVDVMENGFTVQRMSEHFDLVLEQTPEGLVLLSDSVYKKDEFILISDCYHAEIRKIFYVQHRGKRWFLGLNRALTFKYSDPVYLGERIRERFFIQTNPLGDNALYYKKDHTEELTSSINRLSADIKHHHDKVLVRVKLGLKNNKTWLLETTVRAS